MSLQAPEGFATRPAVADDLEAVVDLMNAVTRADAGKSDMSPFSLRRYWESGDVNLERDTLLVTAADGRTAGFAQFIEETAPSPCDVDTWVHPNFDASGIGEFLLGWIDTRAGMVIERAAAAVSGTEGIPDTNTSTVLLDHFPVYASNRAARQRLESSGYECARIFYRMAIEFTEPPPEPTLPGGISIRTFRRGAEERALYDAFREAQADEWGQENPLPFEKWQHYFIDAEDDFDPEAWFLAVEGETIVGYALCRWDRAGEPERSTVRYLAVRRRWRKRGIAIALLYAAFDGMYRRGKHGAGLGVDATSFTGADRLYLRAGMHRESEKLTYRKVIRKPQPPHGKPG